MDISEHLEQVAVGVYEDGFVPASKKLSVNSTTLIDSLRIHPIDVPHAAGQIRQGSLKKDMVVIWKKAVG
jgi:hypothetical protein